MSSAAGPGQKPLIIAGNAPRLRQNQSVPVYETYLIPPAAPPAVSTIYVPESQRNSSRRKPLGW